jgi:hypothetical protein
MPGRQALEHERQRGLVADTVGDRERQRAGRGRVLRVATGPAEGDDALAGVLAHARDLGAGDERQLVLGEVGVRAPVGVGEVQAGAADAHEHLAGLRRGLGQVDELEHLGAAVLGHLDRAHRRRTILRAPCRSLSANTVAEPIGSNP